MKTILVILFAALLCGCNKPAASPSPSNWEYKTITIENDEVATSKDFEESNRNRQGRKGWMGIGFRRSIAANARRIHTHGKNIFNFQTPLAVIFQKSWNLNSFSNHCCSPRKNL
jgi:hypothetical protein